MKEITINRCILICISFLFCASLIMTTVVNGAETNYATERMYSIIIEGKQMNFTNAEGDTIYPISFRGTTYVPIRFIGEMMGKEVNWDEDTKTIILSGNVNSVNEAFVAGRFPRCEKFSVDIRPDVSVIIDGKLQRLTDTNNNVVYPLYYDNSIYLPLRGVSIITGKEVIWDDQSQAIHLRNTMSPEKKTELLQYIQNIEKIYDSLSELVDKYRRGQELSELVNNIRTRAVQIKSLPIPDSTLLDYSAHVVQKRVNIMLQSLDDFEVAQANDNLNFDEVSEARINFILSCNIIGSSISLMHYYFDPFYIQTLAIR